MSTRRPLVKGDVCQTKTRNCVPVLYASCNDDIRRWLHDFCNRASVEFRPRGSLFDTPGFDYTSIQIDDKVIFLQALNVTHILASFKLALVLFKGKLVVTWYSALTTVFLA